MIENNLSKFIYRCIGFCIKAGSLAKEVMAEVVKRPEVQIARPSTSFLSYHKEFFVTPYESEGKKRHRVSFEPNNRQCVGDCDHELGEDF
ncbi:hypothetical protein HYW44_02870 [Candidatus Daviesbacteria bacterium]|nr:hypothetical protein [Candidatus Daviesbacteria bacterium]